MFERKYRLPATTKLVNARRIQNPYCSILFTPNHLSYNRYGFVVSKKIDKRAVGRNRIKRIVRSAVEQLSPTLGMGTDFLFMPRFISEETRSDEVKKVLTEQFGREGLL